MNDEIRDYVMVGNMKVELADDRQDQFSSNYLVNDPDIIKYLSKYNCKPIAGMRHSYINGQALLYEQNEELMKLVRDYYTNL